MLFSHSRLPGWLCGTGGDDDDDELSPGDAKLLDAKWHLGRVTLVRGIVLSLAPGYSEREREREREIRSSDEAVTSAGGALAPNQCKFSFLNWRQQARRVKIVSLSGFSSAPACYGSAKANKRQFAEKNLLAAKQANLMNISQQQPPNRILIISLEIRSCRRAYG